MCHAHAQCNNTYLIIVVREGLVKKVNRRLIIGPKLDPFAYGISLNEIDIVPWFSYHSTHLSLSVNRTKILHFLFRDLNLILFIRIFLHDMLSM